MTSCFGFLAIEKACLLSGFQSVQPVFVRLTFSFVMLFGFFAHFSIAQAETGIDVRFTNPTCPSRAYQGYIAPVQILPASDTGIRFAAPEFIAAQAVPLRNGVGVRSGTKEGAYCFREDASPTDARPNSVFQKIKELIESMDAEDKIQISTFSFSNSSVSSLLCRALERGVKLEVITGTDSPLAENLASSGCGGNKALLVRGAGTSSGRLQHAKFILFTDSETEQAVVSFQSANISSGVSLHHENWTFVPAAAADAFVQKHACQFASLRDAHFNSSGHTVETYRLHYQKCLNRISATSSIGVEAFFVPAVTSGAADGKRALDVLVSEIANADQIDVVSHHLTNHRLLDSLKAALGRGSRVRVLIDSELFWVGNSAIPRDAEGAPVFKAASGYPLLRDKSGVTVFDHYGTVATAVRTCERGPSYSLQEYDTLQELALAGAELRYFEANHREQYFQHNKFLVMRKAGSTLSAFTGAGNLSQAGFGSNGENYYLIKDVNAAKMFAEQYDNLWENISTLPEDLPVTWATQVAGDSSWSKWSARIFEKKVKVCP